MMVLTTFTESNLLIWFSTTIFSILRLWRLVLSSGAGIAADVTCEYRSDCIFVNANHTYPSTGATEIPSIFSVVETNLSIICACLPTLSPLVRLSFSRTFRNRICTARNEYGRSPVEAYDGTSRERTREVSKISASWGQSTFASSSTDEEMQLPTVRISITTVSTFSEFEHPLREITRPSSHQSSYTPNVDEKSLDESNSEVENIVAIVSDKQSDTGIAQTMK